MTDDCNHGELIRNLIRFKIDEEEEVRAEKGTMVLSLYVMYIKESEISHQIRALFFFSLFVTAKSSNPFQSSSVLENNPIFNFLTTHELSFFVKRNLIYNFSINHPPPFFFWPI